MLRLSSTPSSVCCGICRRTDKLTCPATVAPNGATDVDSYQHRVLTDRATGNPVFLLATGANGRCVYLGASGCAIYDRRPLLCRTCDCRKRYLIVPRRDRDNLVKPGLSSRAVRAKGMPRKTRRVLLVTRDGSGADALVCAGPRGPASCVL
jgi:hypothetical protein